MNDWTDSANYHAAAACHGIDALHAQAPDELMMQMEEAQGEPARRREAERQRAAEQVECLMSVLQALTWRTTGLLEIRDRLAVLTGMALPDLLPAEPLWHGAGEWAAARTALASCQSLSWEPVTGRVVVAVLTADGWEPRPVGYRALVLLYCLQRDKGLRPRMAASLETIGTAIGLTATNKRAAVSAACKRLVADLVRAMQRQSGRTEHYDLWFTKSRATRAKLAESMKGKRNRAVKGRRAA